MNDILFRIFIKDYKNTDNPAVREKYGRLAGLVGIISNTVLCVIKIIAGWVSGSISVLADGINNLTDASSSIMTLAGFKLASIPGDKRHPFGHARIEYISGIFVSIFVLIAGISLAKSSVLKIIHPVQPDTSNLLIGILIFSILAKVWQAAFNINAGRKINSVTLKAAGKDSRNDVISTTGVLAGILIMRFADVNIDGWIGLAVAVFIIISGISLVLETSSPLIGEAPDEAIVNQIKDIALSYKKVIGVHSVYIHNYGPGKTFASMHLEFDEKENLFDAHEVADSIENRVKKNLKIDITCHMDPVKERTGLR